MTARSVPIARIAAAIVAIAAAACSPQPPVPDGIVIADPPAGGGAGLSRHSSMTILPVVLGDTPSPQVAEALGMLLERAGMDHLELADGAFKAPSDVDVTGTAEAVAAFVKGTPPPEDFVLYAEIRGTPQSGITEVRSVIVSRAGDVVWRERQAAKQVRSGRHLPREPLACCAEIVHWLRPVAGLGDPARHDHPDGPDGPLASRWAQRTGLPDEAERTAMAARLKALSKAAPTATLLVFRPRAPEQIGASAADLAARIGAATPLRTHADPQTPALKVVQDMNEQRVLWSMARGLADYTRTHPPDADYVLFADYLMGTAPSGKVRVGAVHLAICNRAGELVAVDFQNDHSPEFRAIAPTSVDGCDRLVARRVAELLTGSAP